MKPLTLLAAVLVLAVAACTPSAEPFYQTAPVNLNQGFGNTVRNNIALQIVNPTPVYAGFEIPEMDGVRSAGAMQRYQRGQVIAPEEVITTN